MRRFIRFCGWIKYLGLLGLPGLFFDNRIFDFLWLFWLFGLIDILYNFHVFMQCLKQIFGIIIIPFRYGSKMPDTDSYRCRVKYSLPFEGEWTVVNGGVDMASSHSWDIPTQRYAYDFIILNDTSGSFEGDAKSPASYYCYGRDILAAAEGVVAQVGSGQPDSLILGNGQADCSARDIRGNYILIKHAQDEYSLSAHLMPDSIIVKVGETVRRGQKVARCGNSGNSSEPHLHFHLQGGTSFYSSAGLPVEFEGVAMESIEDYSSFDPRPVPSTENLPDKYIVRGHRVFNKIL